MDMVFAFAIGIVLLCMIGKIVALPMHLLWKLVTNSIAGAIMLWFVNLFGAGIHITFFKALVSGLLGIPGVIIILILNYWH